MLPKYVAIKYVPYIAIITITVAITDGSKSFSDASPDNRYNANFIPNIECITANNSGAQKNIPTCLNNDLFIIFSSHPIFLKSNIFVYYLSFLLIALMLILLNLLLRILYLNKLL